MTEGEKILSLTPAASCAGGRARKQILVSLIQLAVLLIIATDVPAVAEEVDLSKEFLAGPMAPVEDVVFAVRSVFNGRDGRGDWHWYANIGYYATGREHSSYGNGGRLCKLNVKTGQMTVLVEDIEGSFRDPVVHYDGKRILFSYRRGGTDNYLLYAINSDGTDLEQVTDGEYDDIEPCWLPDGGIVFVTTRGKRWVNCWLTQAANIWRCDADGKNMRALSVNIEMDNTPWVLPDGRILYMRWEYVDRSQLDYHHLWAMHPDGTGQMVYFGNLHPGDVYIDAKPVPGSEDVVLIKSPGHGMLEHGGALATVNGQAGPDALRNLKTIKDGNYRDPWAFSRDEFMVASDNQLLLINGRGQTSVLYALPPEYKDVWLHEPRPILPHPREATIPPRVDLAEKTGWFMLDNAYHGRNMAGVKPGEIKKLMIVEILPKPVNLDGYSPGYPISYGGTFTLERALGVVPLEADGSAYFEAPAHRCLFFILLDENGKSIQRMQSFTSLQPGEIFGCLGCHEERTETRPPVTGRVATAFMRAPSVIEPIQGLPDLPDFPRDIQPVIDRNCLACHDHDKRRGGVILSADHGPMFSFSYYTLTVWKQIADGRDLPRSNYAPRKLGSGGSALLEKLEGKHHDVKATEREKALVRLWLDLGAPYPGTYAALATGMIGGYVARQQNRNNDADWPETKAAQPVFNARCISCHDPKTHPVAQTLSDEMGLPIWEPVKLDDPRLRYTRHLVFNLSKPEKSLILLAPLAKSDGGYGLCRSGGTGANEDSKVFVSKDDPDYKMLLAMVEGGKRRLEEFKRFDMPGFKPCAEYVREMKRFGILPEVTGTNDSINVYATDKTYWESLWWRPRNPGK